MEDCFKFREILIKNQEFAGRTLAAAGAVLSDLNALCFFINPQGFLEKM
jgi:hypothetical protein